MKNKTELALVIIFIVSFMMFLSCGKRQSELKGTIEEENGVNFTHNFQANQNSAFIPIEFVEDISIGIEEGDENYMFNYPADIDSDSEGDICVLDFRNCLVKKYQKS